MTDRSSPDALRYRSFAGLANLPPRYDALFDAQLETTLYLTRHWFRNLLDTCFEPDEKCMIACVESTDGEPLMLLMTRAPAGQNGSVYAGWRLGAGTLAGLTNYQSSYFAPLSAVRDEATLEAVCTCLAKGLADEPANYHMIDLNLMDPSDATYDALIRAFRTAGFSDERYLYKGNWYERLDVADSGEYVSTRSKSSRKAIQNFQRKRRKLEREARIEVRTFCGGEQLDQVLASYDDIYTSSWRGTDAYPHFATGLIEACAERGSLRFVLVLIDGEPAAFEMAVVTGNEALMMRTAYVEKYQKLSVGSIAILAMIERLIDIDRVSTIDFGTDDDAYKATWVSVRRERWGLTFVRRGSVPGWLMRARLARRHADRRARDLIKSLLGRKSSAS